MKFLSKKSCLSLALLASMSLVGCGGGGGHSDPAPVSGPSASVAAEAVVSPIVKNSDTILKGEAPKPAAFRFSVNEDANAFDVSEANSIIANLLGSARAGYGRPEDLVSFDDSQLFGDDYCWIASFSNGVYERTRYHIDYTSQSPKPVVEAVYKINNCVATIKDEVLTALTINKGSTFEVTDESWNDNYYWNYENQTGKYEYKKSSVTTVSGVFNTRISWTLNSNSKNINPENRVYRYYGSSEDITDDEYTSFGFMPAKEDDRKYVYDFSDGLDITIKNYTYQDIERDSKKITGDLNINFAGLTGNITKGAKYNVGYYCSRDEQNKWVKEADYQVEFRTTETTEKHNLNITTPVTLSLNNINASNGSSNAKIKSIKVIVNKLVKADNIREYVVNDAEAHLEVEALYKEDKPIYIGNKLIGFTTAKIDVTGLQCKDGMEDAKMLANAKAKLEAKEENSKISISAEYDYAKKTATAKLINNGDTTVTDGIMVFNFKTADITATNADALLKPRFEGALLDVTAIEKDGAISQRRYKVVDGKLELLKKNDRIEVTIPKDLPQSGSDIAKAAEDAKDTATAKDDTTATFKVGKKTDGSTVATFDKPSSGDNKEVKINAAAKNKIIMSVGFYGSEFTIVFAFDTANHIIKGSVFKGKVENAKLEGQNPVATFASTDGKTVTLFGDDSSSTTFPVK